MDDTTFRCPKCGWLIDAPEHALGCDYQREVPKVDEPKDPFTAMEGAAAQLHEVYVGMVAAGFTEDQAMQLLCAMVAASMRSA